MNTAKNPSPSPLCNNASFPKGIGPRGGVAFYNIKEIEAVRGVQYAENDYSEHLVNEIKRALGSTKFDKLRPYTLEWFLTYRKSEVTLYKGMYDEVHSCASRRFKKAHTARKLSQEARQERQRAIVEQADRLIKVILALRH